MPKNSLRDQLQLNGDSLHILAQAAAAPFIDRESAQAMSKAIRALGEHLTATADRIDAAIAQETN